MELKKTMKKRKNTKRNRKLNGFQSKQRKIQRQRLGELLNLKPFFTRGMVLDTNGERNVVMDKTDLNNYQRSYVIGIEKELTEELHLNKDFDDFIVFCYWIDKEDYMSCVFPPKSDVDKEKTYKEVEETFRNKLISLSNDEFIPLNKTSQTLFPTLSSHQHKENNRYYKQTFHQLNDKGICLDLGGKTSLVKDEKRNGWIRENE